MSRSTRRSGAMVALVTAIVVVALGCAGSDDSTAADDSGASGLAGYTREPVPSVADVELDLTSGGSIGVAASEGGLRIVYFGYTSCPDVCPTTMSDLRGALADLTADEQDRVEVVMVTVDPDRDVPEKLDAYVTTFFPDGDASRFDESEALAEAAAAFGAQYSVETDPDGEVEVGHSADLYAVDDAGDIVLQWPFGTSAQDIADDLSTLLDRADQV